MLLLRELLLASCLLVLSSITSAQPLYTKPCPLLDLSYPALSSYASSNVIQSAMTALNVSLNRALNQTTVYGQIDAHFNAFSVDVYSLHDRESLFTYHHTPDQLPVSVGVTKVDSNTVYRLGSVSKMMTVYIYLMTAGDDSWNQPVTKFVPELAAYVAANRAVLQNDRIGVVDWSSITIGALASQMAGIAREDVYSPGFEQVLQDFGLPPPSRSESSFCGDDIIKYPCNRTAFFNDFLKQRPVTSPFQTPVYSNIGFQILGYALENITAKSMSGLFNQTLVQRLSLNSTYYSVPPSPNTSYIPVNESVSLWNYDARDESPTGGYFSSTNDMRAIGRSILNSSYLTSAQTRRWMRPHAFTANVNLSVGAPWEIFRAPGEPVSWLYTKAGVFGAYASKVIFWPEYNVGITVLSAGVSAPDTVRILSDIVAEYVVPAVYNASKAGAVSTYTGTYSNSSANSMMTISAPVSGPGVVISNWTLNGTPIIPAFATLLGLNQTAQSLNVSLYPSGLTSNNGTKVSWRALFEVLPQPLDSGTFSENCFSWISVNTFTYGGVGLDEFVFTLDQNGKAVSVEPRVLGLTLSRAN